MFADSVPRTIYAPSNDLTDAIKADQTVSTSAESVTTSSFEASDQIIERIARKVAQELLKKNNDSQKQQRRSSNAKSVDSDVVCGELFYDMGPDNLQQSNRSFKSSSTSRSYSQRSIGRDWSEHQGSVDDDDDVSDISDPYSKMKPMKASGSTASSKEEALKSYPKIDFFKGEKVRFKSLKIREYKQILTDNPAVTGGGPALGIDWQFIEHPSFAVDDFERIRNGYRRSGPDLLLDRQRRHDRAVKLGYKESQIAETVRGIHRAQRQRRNTVVNMNSGKVEEYMQSVTKRMKGFVMRRRGSMN